MRPILATASLAMNRSWKTGPEGGRVTPLCVLGMLCIHVIMLCYSATFGCFGADIPW